MAIVGIAPDPQQSAHGSGARRGADGLGADADCRPADLLLSALAGFAAARRALLPAAAAAETAAAAAPASDGGFASRRAARLRSLERGAARCAVALRLLVPAVQAEGAPGAEAGQAAGEAPGPAREAAARGSARGTQAALASAGVSPGSDAVVLPERLAVRPRALRLREVGRQKRAPRPAGTQRRRAAARAGRRRWGVGWRKLAPRWRGMECCRLESVAARTQRAGRRARPPPRGAWSPAGTTPACTRC